MIQGISQSARIVHIYCDWENLPAITKPVEAIYLGEIYIPNEIDNGKTDVNKPNILVKLDRLVEGNVVVEEGFAHECNQIATHGQQQDRVAEHHHAGRAAGDGHTVAGHSPQARRLG